MPLTILNQTQSNCLYIRWYSNWIWNCHRFRKWYLFSLWSNNGNFRRFEATWPILSIYFYCSARTTVQKLLRSVTVQLQIAWISVVYVAGSYRWNNFASLPRSPSSCIHTLLDVFIHFEKQYRCACVCMYCIFVSANCQSVNLSNAIQAKRQNENAHVTFVTSNHHHISLLTNFLFSPSHIRFFFLITLCVVSLWTVSW